MAKKKVNRRGPNKQWNETRVFERMTAKGGEYTVLEKDFIDEPFVQITSDHRKMNRVPDETDFFRDMDIRDANSCLKRSFETLSSAETQVLTLRFWGGLGLKEIATMKIVSRTRILQIERKALRKLRHPGRAILLPGGKRWLLGARKREYEQFLKAKASVKKYEQECRSWERRNEASNREKERLKSAIFEEEAKICRKEALVHFRKRQKRIEGDVRKKRESCYRWDPFKKNRIKKD